MYIDLQYRLRFFDNLLDLMPVGVAVRDVEGHYTLVNRAWEESAGLQRAQVLGKTAFELFPHQRAHGIDSTDREVLALDGKTVYSDFHTRGADGAERHFSVSKTAMLDASRIAAPAEPAGTSLARRVPLEILVVDDHEVNRRIARLLLGKLGYRADEAAGGRQAVAAVGRKRYDVVLMDVQMPEMDGFEATREIRARLGENRPVVVAMTANVMEGDRERCLAAGMDDYLGKPLEVAAMQAVIERWGRGKGPPGVTGTPAASGARADGVPLVNWSRLEEIREYDSRGSLVRKVVASFVSEGKSRIAAIGRAAESRDAAALASAAHALKGAALNVGAAALAELCAALEGWGREGRMDRAVASAALLRQRFKETAKALETSLPAQARRSKKPSEASRTPRRKRRGTARRTR